MTKTDNRVPQLAHEDKPENERKYRVTGENFKIRVKKLTSIFKHVVACTGHFRTLDLSPHTDDFDPELAESVAFPHEVTPLRSRFYWSGKDIKGYRPTDKTKAEVRTEQKIGKGYHQQVLKIGRESTGTLSRGEFKRNLDGFGVNLDVYKTKERDAASDIMGENEQKPIIWIQSTSTKVLFHPDGREDILLEIKFDHGKGRTFDGFARDIVEIEIEVKECGLKVSEGEIEQALDRTEAVLMKQFADDLEPIHHSKVFELVQHLYGRWLHDKDKFHKAFKVLKGTTWDECKPL